MFVLDVIVLTFYGIWTLVVFVMDVIVSTCSIYAMYHKKQWAMFTIVQAITSTGSVAVLYYTILYSDCMHTVSKVNEFKAQ